MSVVIILTQCKATYYSFTQLKTHPFASASFGKRNAELIRRPVDQFNWQKAYLNKNVNEKVSIFNETILNILRNFILHETVLCDDRDPPWFNNKIKSLIHQKSITFKRLRSDRRNSCLRRQLNCLQGCLNGCIEASKQKNITVE